jgi:hypothetical protein
MHERLVDLDHIARGNEVFFYWTPLWWRGERVVRNRSKQFARTFIHEIFSFQHRFTTNSGALNCKYQLAPVSWTVSHMSVLDVVAV